MFQQSLTYLIFKLSMRLFWILQFSLVFSSYAKDIDQNIYINSDQLIFNKIDNSADFNGEVILWFDNLLLKTNNLKIIYKNNHKKRTIDKILIPQKLISKKGEDDILIADSGEYLLDSSKLTLIGNVKLLYKDNVLKTDKLVYYEQLRKIDNKDD